MCERPVRFLRPSLNVVSFETRLRLETPQRTGRAPVRRGVELLTTGNALAPPSPQTLALLDPGRVR